MSESQGHKCPLSHWLRSVICFAEEPDDHFPRGMSFNQVN